MLSVSQFTLLAQIKKGNKPDFRGAADANKARELYDYFYSKVRDLYTPDRVKNGVFQAMMEVGLVNDGPVGVDYRSDDGAVSSDASLLSCSLTAADAVSGNSRNRDQPSGETRGRGGVR